MNFELVEIKNIEEVEYDGNVYDLEVEDDCSYNVDGILVHNSVCSTSINTGIGQGIASALIECVEAKKLYKRNTMILADGGASNPGDIVKAIALGADLVMTGTLFAGVKESAGDVIIDRTGAKCKVYRGSASYGSQEKVSGKKPRYVEGGETQVLYKPGGAEGVVQKIEAGMRSALSYMGAKNLKELQENADFVCYHLDSKLF